MWFCHFEIPSKCHLNFSQSLGNEKDISFMEFKQVFSFASRAKNEDERSR